MDVKKYSCDRCGKALKTNHRWSLLRHIKNIHEGDVNQVILKEEKLQKKSKKKNTGRCTQMPRSGMVQLQNNNFKIFEEAYSS